MQKIVTFLTFNNQAEQAANFYTSLFKNAKITSVTRYGEGAPAPKGTVMSATFELDGQQFYALNGGPTFSFSQGISLFVNCETQTEIDHLWNNLAEGGEPLMCGWVKDRFGVCWQIVPTILGKLLGDADPKRSQRAMQAMMGMVKLDIATLQRAAEG